MRALALAWMVAIAGLCACSMDTSADAVDRGNVNRDPADDCVAKSCADLEASCGSIDDGCGRLIDCGGCADGVCGGGGTPNQCGTGTECVPRTCAEVGAECGLIVDGCGGTIECAGCDGLAGAVCSDNQCVVEVCEGEGKNACNGCGELPIEPGAICDCEGEAECTVYGIQCDDGDTMVLDDGDDQMAWAEVDGIAELSVQEWDYDEFEIAVEDTAFGVLAPEFVIEHPGGYDLNVCVLMDGITVAMESYCEDGRGQNLVEDGVRRGCCMTLGAGDAGDSELALDFPFAPLSDYSARYTVRVRAMRPEGGQGPDHCEPYTIRYRF